MNIDQSDVGNEFKIIIKITGQSYTLGIASLKILQSFGKF